jgi:hypothetical protein
MADQPEPIVPPSVEAGIRLRESHRLMRKNARAAALAELGPDLEEAYSLAYQAVAMAALQRDGIIAKVPEPPDRRSPILAAFVMGLSLVEEALLDGFNPQASALVRQEVEAIAALEEIRLGRRVEGRTPNVSVVETLNGRVYGGMSNAAHLSHHETLRNLVSMRAEVDHAPGPVAAYLMSPQHLPETTRRMFGLHVLLMIHLVNHQEAHLEEMHGAELSQEAVDVANRATKMLAQAGIIIVDEGP